MHLNKQAVSIGISLFTVMSSMSVAVQAAVISSPSLSTRPCQTLILAQTDQSQLVAENKELLLTNRENARKIATKLGITSTGELPTSGSPLEQNQVLILQNQETFKSIAEKVGATVPALSKPEGTDLAEQNHALLLQNRQIVGAISQKIGVTLSPPPELTGSFVEKNHTLLLGNKAALGKIAEKLEVK